MPTLLSNGINLYYEVKGAPSPILSAPERLP